MKNDVFVTGKNASIKITHGATFCSHSTRATRSTDYRQIWYVGGNQKSPTSCQISHKSVHIWGFLTPKLQKSRICKLIRPKFYAPTKMFQIWCHSVHNCYMQKTAVGQFPLQKYFRRPLAQKLGVRSEKVRGMQKWNGRPLCACKDW